MWYIVRNKAVDVFKTHKQKELQEQEPNIYR